MPTTTKAGKKRRLGRGLDSLLGPSSSSTEAKGAGALGERRCGKKGAGDGARVLSGGDGFGTNGRGGKTRAKAAVFASSAAVSTGETGGERALLIDIERMAPNSAQPRKHFPEKELAELADSIAKHGLLQPVLIRPLTEAERAGGATGAPKTSRKKAKKAAPGPDFCIIAGERRWRAAAKAGLHKLPVIIRQAESSREEALWSLTENIQRSDLNPLEEAEAYKQLMQGRKSLTQEGLAKALGRSRASIANQLRLLNLDPQVKDWLRQGRLSFSQAREILGEKSAKRQRRLAKLCMEKAMTVRGISGMQKKGAKDGRGLGGGKNGRTPAWAVSSLSELRELSARNIRLNYSNGKGALSFPFQSEKDLKRLFHALWPKS